MFNLFGKKKKADPNAPIYSADNPLFKRFPLNDTQKAQVKEKIDNILTNLLIEGAAEELTKAQTAYPENPVYLKKLQFDNMGWKKVEEEQRLDAYVDEKTGNYLLAYQEVPNGSLEKMDINQEFPLYRDWLRDQFVQMDGGLISCEIYNENGIFAYESIAKAPRPQGETGMDYHYFLTIHNKADNRLDQLRMTLKELGDTGMRDNLIIHPLEAVLGMDMMEIAKYFRQDPYEPEFGEGNVRNASELEEFDYLFPFHPLSVLRMQLRPRLLKSLKYLDKMPEGQNDIDDIEVEFEEL